MRVRQQRVHRMAHLVRQREHRVERVVVVQQHVRMDAVHRRRVRAAALAGVLVDVDPVAEQHAPQFVSIRLARAARPTPAATRARSRTGTSRRNRRAGSSCRSCGRCSRPSTRLAQPVIAAQRLGAGLRRLDQVLDHRRRNVVAVQRRVERGRIAARLRVKPVALQHAVVQRRVGVDVGLEDLVVRRERRSRDRPDSGWSPESRGTARS